MQTLIVQSYRTAGVAPWVEACLQSVRAWAAAAGYSYEFVDDRLFDYAPDWVRRRCGSEILPVTDLARLYLLRERLQQGWRRVVWVDADVIVFAPRRFALDAAAPYALCREIWLQQRDGEFATVEAVNNAVVVMTPNQPILDFWIFAAEEILRTHPAGPVDKMIIGTRLLTDLASAMPLRTISNVGLFSPVIVHAIAAGAAGAVRHWARQFGHPIGAANLCASLQDVAAAGARVGADELQRAVDVLLRTRGDVVNQHVPTFAYRASTAPV